MQYRTEIDGLRAIAVLSVIFYHLGLVTIGAGFAGVDVFFVISGYLIGGLILKECATGDFRFRNFFARRARRIFPALFAVILITFAVGWMIMLPKDYQYFLGGGATAVLSLSNIWFASRIDYFNPQAEQDPLIHTWSLGVEEQFYLVVPILIVLGWKFFRSYLLLTLIVLTVASFILAVWMSDKHPQLSFYMLPSRAWELLVGVIIALRERHLRNLVSDLQAAIIGNLSLVVLISALLLLPKGLDWPGAFTLVPVLATAGVLSYGSQVSIAKRMLSSQPLRMIGLMSYSAYLIHQPFIGFMSYLDMAPRTLLVKLVLLLSTFVLAYLSWRLIETPFRQQGIHKYVGRGLLAAAAIGIVGLAIFGDKTDGIPKRFSGQIADILAVENTFGPNNKRCLNVREDVPQLDLDATCVLGPDKPQSVAIWGDSHGAAIIDEIADQLAKDDVATRTYLLSSCLPVPGLLNHGQKRAARCAEFNQRVLAHITADDTLEVIVLVATWDNYFMSEDQPNMLGAIGDDSFYSYPTTGSPYMAEDERQKALRDAVTLLLEQLVAKGKSVVLVQSNPRPNINIPRLLARKVNNGEDYPKEYGYDRRYFESQVELSYSIMQEAASKHPQQVSLVYPEAVLCDTEVCKVIIDNEIMFSDDNHLSVYGSKKVAIPIVELVSQMLSD
jgi:peptidoglycan/LPS O-acetylase OafA/YrhL